MDPRHALVMGTMVALVAASGPGCKPGTIPLDDDDSAEDVVLACPDDVADALAALADWEARISCAKLEFGTAPDDEQTMALTISLNLDALEFTEGQFIETAVVDDALMVQVGENLLHYDCNDALWLDEVVDREWRASAGAVGITVTSNTTWDATVDMALTGAVVDEVDDPVTRCELPDVVFTDLSVGWYPG